MRGISVNGARFRQLRRARGLTQRELGLQAGVGERTVRNAEAGRRIGLEFLGFLAEALGCVLVELVDDRDEMRVALREQRRVEHILEAISVQSTSGDRSGWLDLVDRDVSVSTHGPVGLAFCGEYHGKHEVQALLDLSAATIAYNSPPKILDIRTGGNLVVIQGVDNLTAIPTGKSFTTPWMNVYEFAKGHIGRLDMWVDIATVQNAFQPG